MKMIKNIDRDYEPITVRDSSRIPARNPAR